MLSPAQRAEFEDRGFVRLPSVFSRAEAAAMEERLWERLGEKHGIREDHSISGISVRVAELVGQPGDVIVGYPWLLHTLVPNRGQRPRFMRVQRILGRATG